MKTTTDSIVALLHQGRKRACEVAAAIHLDDREKANRFASELGGWDRVADRIAEIAARADTPSTRALAIGCAAIALSLGHRLRL